MPGAAAVTCYFDRQLLMRTARSWYVASAQEKRKQGMNRRRPFLPSIGFGPPEYLPQQTLVGPVEETVRRSS